MTTDGVPTCDWCRQPFNDVAGCTATEAAHTQPHDGDGPCRDCSAEPGRQHHPRCCVAWCGADDESGQALMCGCQFCLPVNEPMFEAWATQLMAEHPIWQELDD